jgi:two-component sensor histidine kinase
VLTELLQNAVDHAFPAADGGTVAVLLEAAADQMLHVTVLDDGVGLPEGFSLDAATGLGLSIVRTLVTTELAGTIRMGAPMAEDLAEAGMETRFGRPGTAVVIRVPADPEAR